MKEVIVTGANGFIGSSLIKVLISRGIRVIAIDIDFSRPKFPESDLIYKIETGIGADLANKIPEGFYDAFYHLAWKGVNGAEKSDPNIQLSNIQMAITCADLCKQIGVRKLLCAGTVAENVTFSLPLLKKTSGGMMYGVSKHACRIILENYCKNVGLPFVWMQFSNIFGVGNQTGNLVSYTLNEILNGKQASFGPAKQPYDFIYIDDLIEAIFCLGDKKTEKSFYFIGSGTPRLLKDYLLRIGELTDNDKSIGIGLRPDDGIKYAMEMFDNKDLIDTIGNYVRTSFDDGIIKTIKWMKSL